MIVRKRHHAKVNIFYKVPRVADPAIIHLFKHYTSLHLPAANMPDCVPPQHTCFAIIAGRQNNLAIFQGLLSGKPCKTLKLSWFAIDFSINTIIYSYGDAELWLLVPEEYEARPGLDRRWIFCRPILRCPGGYSTLPENFFLQHFLN